MEYNVHQWFIDVSVCLGRERILACQWIFQPVGTGLLQILCDNQIISSCCQQKWQIFIYKRSLTWIWSLVRFFSASCKRELDANSPIEKFATGKHQFEEIKIFHTKPPISTKTFEDKEGDDAPQIPVGIWHSWYPRSELQGRIFNGPYLYLKHKLSRILWHITSYAWRIKSIITSKENISAKPLSSTAGGLGLTFPREKQNLNYSPRQVTAVSSCNPSATVLNEEPMFLWTGSLPDPLRTAQGGTCFKSANYIKAVVTYCLPSNTSSVMQELSSSLLPLMDSGSCSENPTDRNCRGLPGISHLFPKQTMDVHWVNPNVWMSRSSCGQESRRHGGAMQWGPWASFTGYSGLWVWR